MERLTYKEGNHYYSKDDCIVDVRTINEDSLNVMQNWLDQLGAYEDAEEQGLLLRLPCKVGDTAWYVCRSGMYEVEIDSFVVNINLFVNVSYYIGCERFGKTLTPYKTLFFTREEAKAKLKEMNCFRNGNS